MVASQISGQKGRKKKSIPCILNVKNKTCKILEENIRNFPNDLE